MVLKTVTLLNDTTWSLDSEGLPRIVAPEGLSDRSRENQRNFTRPEVRDQVCLNNRRDDRRSPSPLQSPPSSPGPPPTKRRGQCSNCRQRGHIIRSCPQHDYAYTKSSVVLCGFEYGLLVFGEIKHSFITAF